MWDPRYGGAGQRRQSLAQNRDVAASLLEFFGRPLPEDMEGRPLAPVLKDDTAIHKYVLFGYFGGSTNITDGKYLYMRGPANPDNAPLYEYTLMPARMGSRIALKDLQDFEISHPFKFTKGCRTLKIDMSSHNSPYNNHYRYGNRLYDLEADPGQDNVIEDKAVEAELLKHMTELMKENCAPEEQFVRLGLSV
jgi:hypothetical protein